MVWSEGVPYIFDTKKRGKIIVPPVVRDTVSKTPRTLIFRY